MKIGVFLSGFLLTASLFSADLAFHAGNAFSGFDTVKGLTKQQKNGLLVLNITARDSGMTNNSVAIDPAVQNEIEFRYRAKGLPAKTSGQVYFARPDGNFEGNMFCYIPSLVADGEFHTVLMKTPPKWKNFGNIGRIRFDFLDDGPGGTIELEYIRIGSRLAQKPFSASQAVASDANRATPPDELLFNAANNFAGFDTVKGLTKQIQNGLLVLNITARDSRIMNRHVTIDSKLHDTIAFRYRANGLPPKTSGQIYFAHPDGNFEGNMFCYIPSLVADNQFHTVTIDTPPKWNEFGAIGQLRFDFLDDGPGGTIELEYIRIYSDSKKKIAKRAAREHLAEWPAVKPELPPATLLMPEIPSDYFAAGMICNPQDRSGQPGDYYIRKKFQPPQEIDRALLQMSVDDKYEVYLNGTLLANHLSQNSWKIPQVYDVGKLLLPGQTNVLAVHYRNEGGPGGVLMEVAVRDKQGNVCKYKGDDDSQTAAQFAERWSEADFDDSAWVKPLKLGTPPTAPWTRVLDYQSLQGKKRIAIAQTAFPAQVNAGENLTLAFDSPDFTDGDYHIHCSLRSDYGKPIASYQGVVNVKNSHAEYTFRAPEFFSSMSMHLTYSFDEAELSNVGDVAFQYVQRPPTPEAKSARIEVKPDANGVPRIEIDGVKRYCIIGNDLENRMTEKVFSGVPVDFRTCRLWQNTEKDQWQIAPGKYDFSVVDRHIGRILQYDKKAYFILALDLAPAFWWGEAHPEELAEFSDGSKIAYMTVAPSFASQAWLKDSMESLRALIRHLESAPYAARFGGLLLTNGKTFEWQYWGAHESGKFDKLVDYSLPMKQRFRNATGKEMPDYAERLQAAHGVFLDPVADALKIKANELQSQALADFMIAAVRTARESLTTPKLLGVYYGYHFDYASMLYTRSLCGHNDLARILTEARPDFILSPPTYAIRELGEANGDMKPFRSIEDAGVLSIVDDDTRTHRAPYGYFSQSMTAGQTQDLLRRNFGMALCRGENISILPINSGAEFDSPETVADLETIRKAGNEAIQKQSKRSAEIAVVVDEKSFDYLAFDKKNYRFTPRREYRPDGTVSTYNRETLRLTGELLTYQRSRIAKLGAPADYILASDVEKHLGDYKLWIFLDCFVTTPELIHAVRALQTRNVVLLWFYAPGVISEGKYSAENIGRFTGIEVAELPQGGTPLIALADGSVAGTPEELANLFTPVDKDAKVLGTYAETGKAAFAEKKQGQALNVFFGGNYMPGKLFREYAQRAGVHIYCDSGDVLYAGFGYLTVHAASAGKKTIRLPEKAMVTDLFTGKALTEQPANQFSFNAALHETRIFRIQ